MRILVVDDELEIRKVLRLLLEKASHTVLEAANGADAVDILRTDTYIDLCIMDVMMPRMTGIEATATIRTFSAVPILFLTAKSLEGDKELAYSSGGDDYLVKPFSYAELIMRVEALLRRYRVYRGKTEDDGIVALPCGVEIDISLKTVRKNGEAVALRDKESAILFYLFERRGETVDATELYEAVWEEKAMSTSANNVMVNMLSLRKKLEDDPSTPTIIKTIWGKGYRFV